MGKPGLFICIILLFVIQYSWGHGLKYHEFRSIDHRLGMDASAVNCVVQDIHGLIWLGTDRGLYSFDGYTARHYSAKAQSGQSNDGVVYCAFMVDSVRIWLGTDNGLSVFNTYTDKYEPAPGQMPENIRAISRVNDHSFWIGSINGLYRYDTGKHRSEKINDKILPHQAIYTILRYDDNTFYFGTYNGLCRFNTQTGRFDRIALNHHTEGSNQLILSLLPDYSRNCIWVGFEGGLSEYFPSSGKSVAMPLFKGNSVKSLLLDNQNCLWAGTDNGLFIFEPGTGNYRLIRHDALNDRSIVNNVVWSVFTDREQNIWIGTDAGASLYVFNDQFKQQSISELTGSSEGNYIISLLTDRKGNLWLAGNNGLIKVDKSHGKTIWYQQNNPIYPLPHNKVRSVFEDADGDIWIATDGSICRYNEKTSRFIRYQIEDATHTRNANWSYAICQDETRKLWLATCLGGLFVIDKQKLLGSEGKTYIAERNYYSNNSIQGLSGNMLQFLAIDNNRNIWAGTYRAGINEVDRLNQKVNRFTTKTSELPSDDVTAMTSDSENFIWVALRNKIIRLDTRNHTMKTITDVRLNNTYINALTDDGKRVWMALSSGLFFIDKNTLEIKQINSGGNFYSSIYFDPYSHHVFAGGINSYVEFDPETILQQDQQNHLFITSLWINDKLVQNDSLRNDPVKLGRSVRFTQSIELPSGFNNLSLAFSELGYNQIQNVQYANKLQGLDADWHILDRGSNRITYNNLPPGDYKLMISRIGSDGNPVSNPYTFLIRVNHPWYSTLLAKCIYFVLIVLLVFALINYYIVLNRLRYERIEKVKTMELTAHKIDFLTNISHELKTPLSLIIGPLEKIMEQVRPQALKSQLSDVRQNAMKMGSLIHQMMEASRQEVDGFGLIVSKTDIIAFVQSVVSVFEKPLKEKSVTLTIENDNPSFFIEADVLKLEIILNNILSNASKFAPNGSVITIKTETFDDSVKLTITDQGPGIDPGDLPHVFERYFQSRHSLPQNREGSGVGLSIVKEYVLLHRGTVKVLSDGEHGTTVEIVLPKLQIVDDAEVQVSHVNTSLVREPESKPLLLIVEDNIEIASFISKSLSNEFRCFTAPNGKLGLEMAYNNQPDVIVADIMMPVMDGIEMCRKLKENISTSLIPVVMLTAKDDKNTELLGYRTGADAFIGKPFEIGYLSDRLHQLLRGRNLLVQKARQEAIIQPREKEVLSADEKLLATITQIIENEITNPELNVNVLSEKSGYSLKQIYRRIKSLTGQTAVDYIRSVRLKKAAMLLSRKTFSVAEVMYMVGFSNHSYFAKRFQEMYGKSPKQYAEEENRSRD